MKTSLSGITIRIILLLLGAWIIIMESGAICLFSSCKKVGSCFYLTVEGPSGHRSWNLRVLASSLVAVWACRVHNSLPKIYNCQVIFKNYWSLAKKKEWYFSYILPLTASTPDASIPSAFWTGLVKSWNLRNIVIIYFLVKTKYSIIKPNYDIL